MNYIMKFILISICVLSFNTNLKANSGTKAEDVLQIFFSPQDFAELSTGISDEIRANAYKKKLEKPIETESYGADIFIRDIDFEVKFSGIELIPHDGYLTANVTVDRYQVNIGELEVDHLWTSVCTDIEIHSNKNRVRASFDLSAGIENSSIDIKAKRSSLPLGKGNFKIEKPRNCDAIWGANWIVERVLPNLIFYMRDEISKQARNAIIGFIADKARDVSEDYLQLNVMLPLNNPPFPSIYYQISLLPESLDISSGGVDFKSSAFIDLIDFFGPTEIDAPKESFDDSFLPKVMSSYIAVHKNLVSAVLTELKNDDIFNFEITGQYIKEIKPFLNNEFVSKLLKLKEPIHPQDEVSFRMAGIEEFETSIISNMESGGIVSNFKAMKAIIEVNSEPAFILELDCSLLLSPHLENSRLSFIFERPTELYVRAYDYHTEEPIGIQLEHANDLFQTIFSGLGPNETASLRIPTVSFGNKKLELSHVDAEDDLIKVRAYVRNQK